MLSKFYRNQYWPTHEQQLLLKACLWSGEEAKNAYNQWINIVDIDTLDRESNSLLGLLYRNLIDNNIESKYLGRLKGINRYKWTKNQLLIARLNTIVDRLEQQNKSLICIGDLAILARDYQEYGYKFSNIITILVEEENERIVCDILEQLGWQLSPQTDKHSTNLFYKQIRYVNQQKQTLLIRFCLFVAEPQKHTNQKLWQDAIPQKIGLATTNVLGTNDRLLWICLQANLDLDRVPATRIADAMTVISSNEIDWVDLITKTQRYRLILPVRNMLNCLKNILGVQIPDWVIPSLYSMPIADYEVLKYRLPALNKSLKLRSLFLQTKQLFIQ